MNSVSKFKVTLGYALMLAVLFFSLFFVHREMETLLQSDERDTQWTDSLLSLLREKNENTIHMLRSLGRANESFFSNNDLDSLMAYLHRRDTVVREQHIQRSYVVHRDTLMTHPEQRGFFRRLREAFNPSQRADTSIQVRTSTEYALDTIVEIYSSTDSLQAKLQEVAQRKKADSLLMRRRNIRLQRMDRLLSARIDSLLHDYETESLAQARASAERRQAVRLESARTLSYITIGAVLLSVIFLVIIGRDITRNNRYRRELEEARRRAEDLLATREKLMLAITHDFKAPLGSIMGYADLLSRLTVDERQRFYLDNMKTSSEHLLKLVVDLLDFHRLDLHKVEVNRVTFHPARLVEEVYVSFQPLAAAKGLTLHCHVVPELEGAYISDPLRLREIMTNLLSNAVKFTDQGSITLSASYEERQLVLSVADTGRGMEPADCERVFQEFTRLPGAQGKEGFGLGLSIVRMLVQLLEGSIRVESKPGEGSTFIVTLPLPKVVQSEELSVKEEDSARAALPSDVSKGDVSDDDVPSLRKVLLIDDDRIQLTLTAAMLGQSGIVSTTCQQVDELLDALRTDTYDVLLTDVQMPAINGFDLLNLLRASNISQAQTIPVIAVTARSDMQMEEFTDHGFAGCLHKPFNVSELLAIVSGTVAESGTVSVAPQSDVATNHPHDAHFNFAALTAFSADDPEAAKSILDSFQTETRHNADRLQQAVADEDAALVSGIAHKMIPLFTLIEATALVHLLRSLEARRNESFSDAMKDEAQQALSQIEEVLTVFDAGHWC